MIDEPTHPGEATYARERGPLGHVCEHSGCGKDGGWGFARPGQKSHWYCYEHRGEGQQFL